MPSVFVSLEEHYEWSASAEDPKASHEGLEVDLSTKRRWLKAAQDFEKASNEIAEARRRAGRPDA